MKDLGMDSLPLVERLKHYFQEQPQELPAMMHIINVCADSVQKVWACVLLPSRHKNLATTAIANRRLCYKHEWCQWNEL
jgi:hypothetical protein